MPALPRFHVVLLERPIPPGARIMSTVYHSNMRGLVEDQSRMIVFRREQPRTKSVRDGASSIAQDVHEGSPHRSCRLLRIPTFQAPTSLGRLGLREMPADGPDKPAQFPGTGHRRHLRALATVNQPPILSGEPLL